MDDFLVGLLVVLLGAAVCFLGLRLWFFMLPIWGFVAGFFVGAEVVTGFFGDGFLSTVTGWVFGIVVGLLFALASYLVWFLGALLAAGSVGALAGSGLMAAFEVDSDWIVFLVSAAGALLFVFIALVLVLPVWVVIVSTAMAGAVGVVAGALLIFNQIDLEELDHGATWAMIQDSWFWLLVWVVLAGLGIAAQLRSIAEAALPEDRWARVHYGSPPSVAAA
jgi:hypothetical protein